MIIMGAPGFFPGVGNEGGLKDGNPPQGPWDEPQVVWGFSTFSQNNA